VGRWRAGYLEKQSGDSLLATRPTQIRDTDGPAKRRQGQPPGTKNASPRRRARAQTATPEEQSGAVLVHADGRFEGPRNRDHVERRRLFRSRWLPNRRPILGAGDRRRKRVDARSLWPPGKRKTGQGGATGNGPERPQASKSVSNPDETPAPCHAEAAWSGKSEEREPKDKGEVRHWDAAARVVGRRRKSGKQAMEPARRMWMIWGDWAANKGATDTVLEADARHAKIPCVWAISCAALSRIIQVVGREKVPVLWEYGGLHWAVFSPPDPRPPVMVRFPIRTQKHPRAGPYTLLHGTPPSTENPP